MVDEISGGYSSDTTSCDSDMADEEGLPAPIIRVSHPLALKRQNAIYPTGDSGRTIL